MFPRIPKIHCTPCTFINPHSSPSFETSIAVPPHFPIHKTCLNCYPKTSTAWNILRKIKSSDPHTPRVTVENPSPHSKNLPPYRVSPLRDCPMECINMKVFNPFFNSKQPVCVFTSSSFRPLLIRSNTRASVDKILMEISSFSFTEDGPSLFSFLQDSEPGSISFANPSKRPGHDDFYDSSVEDLLSKLLDFDAQAEEKPAQNVGFVQNSSVSVGSRCANQEMAESGYYFSSYPDVADSGNSSNNKRPRSEPENVVKPPSDESTSAANGSAQRRLWVKNRSKAWWEQVNSPDFPEEEFYRAFRMSRATFDMICEELDSVVNKKDTMLRLAIPVRQRVAVCIWRLATGEALREVSKRFGLGISTCHKLVLEVCTAIKTVLMPKYLQWPDEGRIREIKRSFELVSGIPNVGGSMYTTHVPIIAPKVSVAAYFNKRHTERNQKTSYSITVQGVVNPNGVFTDICIGWPGSMTDDQVLEKSALYQRANRGALKDTWIAGNSSYPLMDWVLVPYTHQNVTWTQHAYNEKIEEIQRVSKESFMRLKARWSCLLKRTEMKLQDLPVVLGACCVLHNICEIKNEGLSPDLRFELFDDEMIPDNNVRSINAVNARDQIAHKLLHHNHAGTNFM